MAVKKIAKKPAKTKSRKQSLPARKGQPEMTATRLLSDIRQLIDEARMQVARAVNAGTVMLYWQIGSRIRSEILHFKRAEYGEEMIATLSQQLTAEYGRGYSRRNLFNMIRFAETFPSIEIVQTLSAQLSWSHFVEIIYLNDDLKREFYAEMCRVERWSVRALREKIGGMLFERTAIAKKSAEVIRKDLQTLRDEDRMTPDMIFRDPYVLDFLGLPSRFSEKDLESAILAEMEKFLLELGTDFSFVARQKRLSIGREDFYLDLLFYHRGLRRLIAIELKLEKFTAAHYGQMELYLRWLDKYERRKGEAAPLGLILCGERDEEQIELLELDRRGIRVSQYLTELPPRDLLATKFHEAIRLARVTTTKKALKR
ncbi:MAG TPA: PDDEXK nuclease domain-containing protein [Blastocatellia bacterium]|nr:PDDEXK nuclease domain-containing protein [Blastocatellia bacterium]